MNEPTISIYRYLLESTPRLGRLPTPIEVQRSLGLGERVVADALRELAEHGDARLDPDSGRIDAVYPYSAGETNHEVVLPSGVSVHCMCAIDCFYVPFLTGADITIRSSCHLCRHAIAIDISALQLSTVEPASTVVWDSDAPFDCPATNFFCCEAHLLSWREGEPGEPGLPRSIDEALRRGQVAAARIRRVVGRSIRRPGR